MSQALTNDGSEVISRRIHPTSDCAEFTKVNCIKAFRVVETASWIKENHFKQIGLQFPDELLHISAVICRHLCSLTGQFCFVLGDSSFAGCCVDEVAGTRFQLDALVHYGRACLSQLSGTLPVLFIFGNYTVERGLNAYPFQAISEHFLANVEQTKSSEPIPLLITYDFRYRDFARAFLDALVCRQETLPNPRFVCVWSEPDLTPPAAVLPELVASNQPWCPDPFLRRCGRAFHLFQSHSPEILERRRPWSLIHLSGGDLSSAQSMDAFTLYRILLCLPEVAMDQAFWLDIKGGILKPVQDQMQRLLRRRSYLIERAKDARRIGILMGTLSVQGFRQVVERIQRLLRLAGRFYVTLVVGRLNEAKLANLPELDLLVLVACPESSLLDSRDMLIPVVTPFELECALGSPDSAAGGQTRSWTGEKWWVDFRDLLPGGVCYCPESEVVSRCPDEHNTDPDAAGDVSLITGKLRVWSQPNPELAKPEVEEGCLVPRDDWAVVESDLMSSKDSRTWFGLDPSLGQHPVSRLKAGRSGVPTQYDSEQS